MAYNILILDQSKWSVWFAGQTYDTGTVRLAKDWCIQENADLCFNLAIFNMKDGKGCCYVHTKNGDSAYGCESYSELLTIDSNNSCRGYSNGIINGKVSINKPMGGSSCRNGIGITNLGHIIIAQSNTRVTESAFCTAVNNFVVKGGQSVKLFLLQDGGGSTQEYSAMSKLNFAPMGNRKVPNVVCVKQKVKQAITEPVYNGSKGDSTLLVQIALGGIECDGIAGSGTVARIKSMQKNLSFPSALQCGVVSAYTAQKLGYNSKI